MSDARRWSIYYRRRVVHGAGRYAWLAAPDHGVQVIVEWRKPDQLAGELKWAGVSDRLLWTGEDEFDPFGYGVKYGLLIPDAEYFDIWERACGR